LEGGGVNIPLNFVFFIVSGGWDNCGRRSIICTASKELSIRILEKNDKEVSSFRLLKGYPQNIRL